jgi:hypothetical protein
MSPMSNPAPLTRIAGPTALAAGVLLVVAELVMWPFDLKAHVATTTDPVFQIAGAVYFVGFSLLLVTAVAAYDWQARSARRFGVVALVAALVGTMALGGDLWFESFAVPWIADRVPQAFDTTPTVVLGLGAISSYFAFALGWVLFGLASLRARVFPVAICCAIVLGGAVAWRALLPPWGAPLGLAIAWLGVWMIRSGTAAAEDAQPRQVQQAPRGAVPAPRAAADLEAPSRAAPQPGDRRP